MNPIKNKRPGLIKSTLNDTSFVAPPIVGSIVDVFYLKPVTFLPMFASACEQFPSLQKGLEQLRMDYVAYCKELILCHKLLVAN